MKYVVEIEGLPEGWEVKGIRVVDPSDRDLLNHSATLDMAMVKCELIVQKTKPRRIVSTGIDSYDPSSPNGYD